MRHNKSGESVVMQEFERIAAEKGWMTKSAQDFPAVPEHIPTHLVKQPQGGGAEPPTTMRDIDKMLAGVKGPVAEPAGYHGTLVQEVQQALMAAKEDVGPYGPDGKWGWFTAKAWNAFAKKNPQLGLPQATETQPPSNALMRKMLGAASGPAGVKTYPAVPEHIPMGLVKEPHMTEPWQYPTAKEMVPKASLAIVDELVALANDLDEMGETKVAEAVDEQLRLYKSAVDKLYDITGETGEQLIGEAHPGGGPTMVPAKDEGGKVETIVEEQKRNMEVARKQPTGKQAAFVAKQLVALANRLDAEGKREAALLVDKALDELREGSRRPFVARGLRREAQTPSMDKLHEGIGEMISGLKMLEDSVQDQMKPALVYTPEAWEPYAISWEYGRGQGKPGFEYDEFLVDSQAYLGRMMISEKPDIADIAAKAQLMRQRLAKMRAFYLSQIGGGHTMGTWDETGYKAFLSGYGKIEAEAQKLPASPKRTTPAPAAGKAEKPAGPAQVGTETRRLRGTIRKLTPILDKMQMDQPPGSRERMLKTLSKTLRGTTPLDFIKWLKDHKDIVVEDPNTANKWNNYIWNAVAKPLGITASANPPMVREAAPPTPPPGFGAGAPKAPAGKGGRPGKKSRPELAQLQSAMMALELPLGGGADGKWGPNTWAAWNTLRKNIMDRRGPDIGRPPAPNTEGPSAAAIGAATNLAKRLGRLQSAQATVAIAPGVRVSEQALSNAQAFMKALSAQPASGVNAQDPPKAQAAAALKVVQSYRQALEQEDSQEAWALSREGVDPRTRIAAVDGLIAQLRAVGTGIPSYRMEGGAGEGGGSGGMGGRYPEGHPGYGRKPYGEEREIGEFGTLGGPGGMGGRGGRGGREGRPEPQMSVADQVYTLTGENIPVNDAQQALFWAYDFWSRHYKEMATVGARVRPAQRQDYHAIAKAVIKYLRIKIANLSGRPEVRNDPTRSLQIELRRFYEDVTAMEQLLGGR